MAENNRLNDMIETTLDRLRAFADANTVIGEPLATDSGTVIIPVSKISIGFAGGGSDFFPKTADEKTSGSPPRPPRQPAFGGGSGTGISVTPVCFLAVKANGDVELLNVENRTPVPAAVSIVDSVGAFIDKSPDLIARFKTMFAKDKSVDGLDDETVTASAAEDSENAK